MEPMCKTPLSTNVSMDLHFEEEKSNFLNVCALKPLSGFDHSLHDGETSIDFLHKRITTGEKRPPLPQKKTITRLQSKLQNPPEGPFDRNDLQWEPKKTSRKGFQRNVMEAIIPWSQLDDFIDGESNTRDWPCTFLEDVHPNKPIGTVSYARESIATTEIRYWCRYGPQDYSGDVKGQVEKLFAHVLDNKKSSSQKKVQEKLQKAKAKATKALQEAHKDATVNMEKNNFLIQDSASESNACLVQEMIGDVLPITPPEVIVKQKRKFRLTKMHSGMSMKRGCQCNFTAKQLYLDNGLCKIRFHCTTHTNLAGNECPGASFAGTKFALAGRLSVKTREWILSMLHMNLSPSQIMVAHKEEVLELSKKGLTPTRDTFIMPKDVYNLAKGIAKEKWERHPQDAVSVRMWTQEEPKEWFYYHEWGTPDLNKFPGEEHPFCLAIQSEWQFKMLLKFGNRRALSMDSTFGTNEARYPLYTIMVFDEWESGIPVAYIIVGRSREADILPWLSTLQKKCVDVDPDSYPNAFVVDNAQAELNAIKAIFPHSKIMLCLWHVRKAWLENVVSKIKVDYVRVLVLKALGDIMYTSENCTGEDAVLCAHAMFEKLKTMYAEAEAFMTYFQQTWMKKTEMWVTSYRNVPHANQNTNAAIENFHGNLKSVLSTSIQRYSGRRLDWLLHMLKKYVTTHYWYVVQCRIYGFVKNGKAEGIVAGAVLRSLEIPDSYVSLNPNGENLALCASMNNFPMVYTITAPNSTWAHCDCPMGQRGNICKHSVKVFKMINPGINDTMIIRHAGTLRGTIAEGFDVLRSDSFGCGSLAEEGEPMVATEDGAQMRELPVDTPEKQLSSIMDLLKDIADFATKNKLLRIHVLSSLNATKGKLLEIEAKSDAGILHPLSQPSFGPGEQDRNLKRHKSFLEYKSWKGGNKKN